MAPRLGRPGYLPRNVHGDARRVLQNLSTRPESPSEQGLFFRRATSVSAAPAAAVPDDLPSRRGILPDRSRLIHIADHRIRPRSRLISPAPTQRLGAGEGIAPG